MNLSLRRGTLLLALLSAGMGVAAPPAVGQSKGDEGRVIGRVLSSQTARPLVSAQVYLTEVGLGSVTAVDGQYVLRSVPPGVYDLTVNLIGYAPKTVTGVQVLAGHTTRMDVTLDPQAIALEGVVVSASAQRGSTTSLLTERKMAVVVSDAIGSDQISRSPDGDAAAALKRVPGVSVVDGRFAFVRGLGERYSSTTLNGAPLASPVPDKKVIPLDVIPSGLLQSIVTSKSYSPNQPGDYAGGLVQLRTKDFPARRVFNVSLSGGWNSVASFQTGLGYAGGASDYLGFDDGSRGLPGLIPHDVPVTRRNFSPEDLQAIGRAFGRVDWAPTVRSLPANFGGSLSFGDDFELGDRRAGFIAALNYSQKQALKKNLVERVFARAGVDDPEVDYRGEIATRSASLGGLLNFTFQPRSTDQITFSTVFNRLADDMSRVLQGFNLDSNTNQWNSRIQYLGQSLLNSQLRGQHALGFLHSADLRWRAAYTRAGRYEPSTREVLYREFDGRFYWDDFIQSGSVFHQDMVDEGYNGGADLELPFTFRDLPASVAVGGSTSRKDRDAFTRRFRFRPVPSGIVDDQARVLTPNELFTDTYIRPNGFEIQEATFRADNYVAREDVDAAYGMLDLEPVEGLRISGGARVERTTQTVDPLDLWDAGLEPLPGAALESTDFLPAVNATVALNDRMNLRASASRTLARPQLRELAPFSFADYAGGYLVLGNPGLERARIENYDLRYEWFANPRAVLAVSGFYKRFDAPIEVRVLPSSELLKTWVNADEAKNYGLEVEARSDLGFVAPALSRLSVNGNLTLVSSEVSSGESIRVYLPGTGEKDLAVVGKRRALQGQSPYVANLGLSWYGPTGGASASVLFNRFGRRIDAVGGEDTPDIFEEARSQLDLTLEMPLASGWRVKLSASRLLGNQVEFTQGGGTLRSFDMGRSVSVSLSWGSGR